MLVWFLSYLNYKLVISLKTVMLLFLSKLRSIFNKGKYYIDLIYTTSMGVDDLGWIKNFHKKNSIEMMLDLTNWKWYNLLKLSSLLLLYLNFAWMEGFIYNILTFCYH